RRPFGGRAGTASDAAGTGPAGGTSACRGGYAGICGVAEAARSSQRRRREGKTGEGETRRGIEGAARRVGPASEGRSQAAGRVEKATGRCPGRPEGGEGGPGGGGEEVGRRPAAKGRCAPGKACGEGPGRARTQGGRGRHQTGRPERGLRGEGAQPRGQREV